MFSCLYRTGLFNVDSAGGKGKLTINVWVNRTSVGNSDFKQVLSVSQIGVSKCSGGILDHSSFQNYTCLMSGVNDSLHIISMGLRSGSPLKVDFLLLESFCIGFISMSFCTIFYWASGTSYPDIILDDIFDKFFHSMLTSNPGPEAVKQVHNMMLHPPSFTFVYAEYFFFD